MKEANRRTFLSLSILLIVACASTSKGLRVPAPNSEQHESAAIPSVIQASDDADNLQADAFELLTKSTTDSCPTCVRDFRRRAFQLLEERFRPGLVMISDSLSRFVRTGDGENELMLTSQNAADPKLIFRFHTTDDHLVGIAESDMTDEILGDRCRSAPDGTVFDGAIEIIAFAYGDGPAFLYHASNNRVEVECRILELAEH